MSTIRTRNLSPVKRKLAKAFCQFALAKFMPRVHHEIVVTIKGSNLLEKSAMYADVIYEDNEPYREFTLRIDNEQSNEMFIRTLAHEVTHIKQWVKREMRLNERTGLVRFGKKHYSRDMDYNEMPWEVEAHGREYGLYNQFVEAFPDIGVLIDESVTDYKLCGSGQMVFKFGR